MVVQAWSKSGHRQNINLFPPPRLPSDWLSLDRSVFQLVAQTMGSRREPEPRENLQESHPPALPSKPPWYAQGNEVLGSLTGFSEAFSDLRSLFLQ